jgi:phosphonate transport system substrate-binding protein
MTSVARHVILGVLSILLLGGCSRRENAAGPRYGIASNDPGFAEYQFAVCPLYNPARLIQSYQPLVFYLNGQLSGVHIRLEASRDYSTFERKMRTQRPEFILTNGWQTLRAINLSYHVMALAGSPKGAGGIFVVRKDSGIRDVADLKGKAISFPAPTSFAACMLPQYFLFEHRIDLSRDITSNYVGSQESSIMNAYAGITAAGATWPVPWRVFQHDHPQEASALRVAWETPPLVNYSVMARNDVSEEVEKKVTTLLVQLGETPEGREVLAGMETECFTRADNTDYDAVRAFVERFERNVRKVESQ